MTWEKKVQTYHQEEIQHSFNANEVFTALKTALTTEKYLKNNIHIFTTQYLALTPQLRSQLLSNSEYILGINTHVELCDYLKSIIKVNELGVFVEGLFPLIENSVSRIGHIIEQLFEKEFEIPGSNLNLDIFFGDYPKTIQGIHRDGANISFVFADKSFSFWEFETIEDEANAYSEKVNSRSALASGAYFFPEEHQERLHEKYDIKAQTYHFKAGEVFYWPTTLWHLSDNANRSVTFTLNIAFYKSDFLAIKDVIQHSLIELERKSGTVIGNGFYDRNLLQNGNYRCEFINEEFQKMRDRLEEVESIYKKSRLNLLNTHLSSFGIKSSQLRNISSKACSDLANTKFFKPRIFKILYTIENDLLIQLHFFAETLKLPNDKKLIESIELINSSNEFSYSELTKDFGEDKEHSKIILKLLNFLSKTPGVYFKGS